MFYTGVGSVQRLLRSLVISSATCRSTRTSNIPRTMHVKRHVHLPAFLLERRHRDIATLKLSLSTLRYITSPMVRDIRTHTSKSASSSLNEISEISSMVQEVLETASKTDVTFLSLHQTAREHATYLASFGVDLNEIRQTWLKSPQLIKISLKMLERFFDTLLLYGFNIKQIMLLMDALENNITEDEIIQKTEFLRSLGFRGSSLLNLLSNYPEVIAKSDHELKVRVADLKQLFKTDDVYVLCVRSGLLYENWSDIKKKFEYVYHVMGIRQRQMVTADLFNYSLEHVQNRHKFLEKAGFYTVLKAKEAYKSTNPKLGEILSLSDRKFASRFGGMSVDDYRVFCSMMDVARAEQRINSDGDDNSDEDDSDAEYSDDDDDDGGDDDDDDDDDDHSDHYSDSSGNV